DVKPGNVILQAERVGLPPPDAALLEGGTSQPSLPGPERAERPRAVLVDFGLSRIFESGARAVDAESVTALTRDDIAVGTIEYMAPEQILRSREVTGTADL